MSLKGAWRLKSAIVRSANTGNELVKPWGENPVGMLMYYDGQVSASVCQGNPKPIALGDNSLAGLAAAAPHEKASAFDAFFPSYFGTYEVAKDGKSVTHFVKRSLLPNWDGTEQLRLIGKLNELELQLLAPPEMFQGEEAQFEINWVRAPQK